MCDELVCESRRQSKINRNSVNGGKANDDCDNITEINRGEKSTLEWIWRRASTTTAVEDASTRAPYVLSTQLWCKRTHDGQRHNGQWTPDFITPEFIIEWIGNTYVGPGIVLRVGNTHHVSMLVLRCVEIWWWKTISQLPQSVILIRFCHTPTTGRWSGGGSGSGRAGEKGTEHAN